MIRLLVPVVGVVVLFCWWLLVVTLSHGDTRVIPYWAEFEIRMRGRLWRVVVAANEAMANLTTAFVSLVPMVARVNEQMKVLVTSTANTVVGFDNDDERGDEGGQPGD